MGLFNSTILEVIIGLIFVYLLLSIMCTAANEWVAALTRRRGETLRRGIAQLLAGQNLAPAAAASDAANNPGAAKDAQTLLEAFYEHPLIASMIHDKNHPAYLSPRNFSATLTDIITGANKGRLVFKDVVDAVDNLPDGEVKRSLAALLRRSDEDLDKARFAIEGWFNDAMDRVSGWYKRRTQLWTIILAAVLTLVANADTIQIARKLWTDPVLRSAVVEEAKARAQKPRPTVSVEYENEDDPTNPTVTRNEGNQVSERERDLLGQLVGWRGDWRQNWSWLTPLGWLLTILAISMGAPFWFDMLNKIMNIRFAGKSPDEKAKVPEKSDSTVRA
ncbi:MAG TPA: hypothetical protein VJP89_13005 [Pyrinomonadaceae bacterium]|nr:hypothetical protein [Pyrinomonadaceae bacterium]